MKQKIALSECVPRQSFRADPWARKDDTRPTRINRILDLLSRQRQIAQRFPVALAMAFAIDAAAVPDNGRSPKPFLTPAFASQLLERGVDPGAVRRAAALQVRQDLVFRLLLGGGGGVHFLDLVEANANQAVPTAD